MAHSDKSIDLAVRISDDYYKAFLSVEFLSESATLKPDDVVAILKERNIVFGIDYGKIEAVCKERKTVFNEVVAEGVPHLNGQHARIDYTYESDHHAKPQVLEDGRVDYKNMGFVQIVKKGNVLAVKTPATKGKSGTTVTGKAIAGKDGRDTVFKIGKNVLLSPDGLKALAGADGTIVFSGDRISVVELLEIKSDIGVETGNILFKGKIVINGNVTSGYSVECEGDLNVNGVVEAAVLKSSGDLVISRGVQGQGEAYLSCKGNLVSNFINTATVHCEGDLEAGAIMNSTVHCNGNVSAKGKKGTIVGGELITKGNVEAHVIGSEMGVITSIKMGVGAEVVDELKGLTKSVKEVMELHEKLEKSLLLLKEKTSGGSPDVRTALMLKKYQENFAQVDSDLKLKRSRLKELNDMLNYSRDVHLKARTLYPGTRIKIGNTSYYVKHVLNQVKIFKDKGEIVTTSW